MKNYKKVLSCIIVISVLFCCNLVPNIAEGETMFTAEDDYASDHAILEPVDAASLREEAGISVNDNAAYMIVQHENGDIESYKVENLLEESITIDNKYVNETEPCAYASSVEEIDASEVPASVYASRDFNWTIASNHTTYSTTKMNLSVGDTVTCSVTANTSKDCYYNVGLWNNANNVFSSMYSVHAKENLNTTNLSWTMAVAGSFSFAIENTSDFSVGFSGSYLY